MPKASGECMISKVSAQGCYFRAQPLSRETVR